MPKKEKPEYVICPQCEGDGIAMWLNGLPIVCWVCDGKGKLSKQE